MIRKRSEAEKTFYSICTLMNAIQLVCPKEYGFFSYFFLILSNGQPYLFRAL